MCLAPPNFVGPQATPKAPPAAPRVPSATSTPYGATPPAPDATMPSYIAAPPAPNRPRPNPAIPSDDGTFTRRMGIAGNNVWVTFSSNDEIASKKAKLFGSSARMDTFNGQDMSRFPQMGCSIPFRVSISISLQNHRLAELQSTC